MRRSTAIVLVLLGGGTIAAVTMVSSKCRDPVTGLQTARGGTGGGGRGFVGSSFSVGSGGTSSSSAVSRGGFGASGSAGHAGS